MPYFDFFPTINYDMNKDKTGISVTYLMRRFRPIEKILREARLYEKYAVQDGDRPDTVSNFYYGTPFNDWLILMFNEMTDPYFHWPLDYNKFQRYLEKQYGSVPASTQMIHHYEWITTHPEHLYDGTNVAERVLWVDQTTYLTLADEDRRIVYVYDWEVKLNQRSKSIKILDPSYLPQIEEERAKIFNA